MLIESSGQLIVYSKKIYVDIDPSIVQLTRILMPKSYVHLYQPQKYKPHISVVRHQIFDRSLVVNQLVTFTYDSDPIFGETYAWFKVYSEQLINVRLSLGLSKTSNVSRPPNGEECFHITIGNSKWLKK